MSHENIIKIFDLIPPDSTISEFNDIYIVQDYMDQVAAATKAYRVYFSKANENQDDDEDYLVNS
eukprot:gene17514-23075_t